jgi:hypothetical protein
VDLTTGSDRKLSSSEELEGQTEEKATEKRGWEYTYPGRRSSQESHVHGSLKAIFPLTDEKGGDGRWGTALAGNISRMPVLGCCGTFSIGAVVNNGEVHRIELLRSSPLHVSSLSGEEDSAVVEGEWHCMRIGGAQSERSSCSATVDEVVVSGFGLI